MLNEGRIQSALPRTHYNVTVISICLDVMIGVLGHDSALLRLYWAGDNFGRMRLILL